MYWLSDESRYCVQFPMSAQPVLFGLEMGSIGYDQLVLLSHE
jgi:hypothetical protein